MTLELRALSVDALDPERLARFWGALLGWQPAADNNFLASCGFVEALAGDGSQVTGYLWSAALGWPLVWDQDEETAIRSPHGGPKISWGGPPLRPKTGKYRLHFDLAAGGGHEAEVERLISLGARRSHIGQGEVDWVVLTDPDGHEFCVWPA